MRLGEIAQVLGVVLDGDPDRVVTGVAPLETAGPTHISFLIDRKYASLARNSRAGALLVPKDSKDLAPPTLRAENPRTALIDLLELFHPAATAPEGIDASAQVAVSAQVHPTATLGAWVSIGSGAVIGEGTWIHPFVYVGDEVEIGADCTVYPHVVIREKVTLGNRVIVHPGVVLGADGFGYVFDGRCHRKIPQVGTVVIEDDVEIGANVTVDRATLGRTLIRRGTKIDNLAQIGHNVEIGEDVILVAQVGISGSCRLGDRVILGGQVGLADHITLAKGVIVGSQSGVGSDLREAGPYLGTPARPAPEAMRVWAATPRLPELLRKVRTLERRVEELERQLKGSAQRDDDDGRAHPPDSGD
ncbi:MAG: UDP-3-O-(3-hydroxymyristoyl)glucosamine N-acyltransferase [Candidatus Methylomirabilia bacterium]